MEPSSKTWQRSCMSVSLHRHISPYIGEPDFRGEYCPVPWTTFRPFGSLLLSGNFRMPVITNHHRSQPFVIGETPVSDERPRRCLGAWIPWPQLRAHTRT